MRTSVAIVSGVFLGLAVAGAAYLAIGPVQVSPLPAGQAVTVPPPPVVSEPAEPRAATPPAQRAPSMPITPTYRTSPKATRPIYRCTSRGGTVYSNEPCPGATVVAEAEGTAGYDSRPSDRLARLVAEGRAAPSSTPSAATRARVPAPRESVECGNLRQQIRDLDATAAYPESRETLDEWRRIRQDIRASMMRSRC